MQGTWLHVARGALRAALNAHVHFHRCVIDRATANTQLGFVFSAFAYPSSGWRIVQPVQVRMIESC